MTKRMNLAGAILMFLGLTVSSLAHAFECTDSSASVDWTGIDFDVYNGPCPASASVTDGAGTATAQADVSTPDTVVLGLAFELTGSSSFVGDIESMATVTFEVDAGGAELAFQSSGSANGFYTLTGPGVALFDVPIVDGTLPLPTADSYELSVRQLYNGGPAGSPFSGSTSATLVQPKVPVPIGNARTRGHCAGSCGAGVLRRA
jgi:hypothetical protein